MKNRLDSPPSAAGGPAVNGLTATQTSPAGGVAEPGPGIRPPVAPVEPAPPAPPGRPGRVLVVLGLVVAAIAAGLYYYYLVRPYESTDDAFIDAHVTAVAPQAPGRVVRLLVNDNQLVQAGDLLLEIDPSDYDVKLAATRAGLATSRSRLDQAKAQLSVDEAKAAQETANVTAALADASRADADYQRYVSIESRAVARSQVDLAQDQARDSEAQVAIAQAKAQAAEAQIGLSQANVATSKAEVQVAEAYVHQAELARSYTEVTAPISGRVTRRAVEVGNYVQVGQPLLAIVSADAWVVANFKETQLAYLRPGQPVEIRVDAYPQHLFKGHVDSIQAGSGARFSLLPPENATGNYVKVVQRVPVKIVFDEPPDPNYPLSPGFSVVPDVRVK
jgi:membrane fusion protein (multidrug efflux system)